MKVYGYEIEGDELLKLEEVSLEISVSDIDELIRFLGSCKEQMEIHGENFGHEHFKDWLKAQGKKQPDADIIVSS